MKRNRGKMSKIKCRSIKQCREAFPSRLREVFGWKLLLSLQIWNVKHILNKASICRRYYCISYGNIMDNENLKRYKGSFHNIYLCNKQSDLYFISFLSVSQLCVCSNFLIPSITNLSLFRTVKLTWVENFMYINTHFYYF